MIQKARVECQSYKLSVEDPVTVEYITRYIATLQQKYTQGRGRRPFGLSTLIVGFDYDGTSHLYQTDPSGTYHEWKVSWKWKLWKLFTYKFHSKANAVGRNAKTVREFLEKAYTDETANSDQAAIKLCIKALLEVVQSGSKNVEIAILRRNQPLEVSKLI